MSSAEAGAGDRVGAVIVAAGAGRRFAAAGAPKQFRPLLGAPLVAWAVSAFRDHPRIADLVLVLPPDVHAAPPPWLRALGATLVAGGKERSDSVAAGLQALGESCQRVLVHDAARPLVPAELIDRVLAAGREEILIPGLPVTDTLKEVDATGAVLETHDRSRFRVVQTPQSFPLPLLREVHARAAAAGWLATDDAALAERCGHTVRIVAGDPRTLKVTTATDLLIAEALAHSLPRPPLPAEAIRGAGGKYVTAQDEDGRP